MKKQFHNKMIHCLLFLMAMFLFLTMTALADETDRPTGGLLPVAQNEPICIEIPAPGANMLPLLQDPAASGAQDMVGAVAYIKQQTWAGEKSIDISQYSIGLDGTSQSKLFLLLFYSDAGWLLSYENPSSSGSFMPNFYCTYLPGSSIANSLEIVSDYQVSAAERVAAKEVFDAGIQKICDTIPAGSSELETVQLVHDYLVAHYSYDFTYTNYWAHEMLRDKVGVCQSYATLFMAVMEKLGMDATFVSSSDICHIWNAVEIGENWYLLDITWDDTGLGEDIPCAAGYDYFLGYCETEGSESRFVTYDDADGGDYKDHITTDWEWGRDVSCSDPAYLSYCYNSALSQVIKTDTNTWYYVGADGLYKTESLSLHGSKIVDSGAYFVFRSGMVQYEGALYYTTSDCLMKYDPETQTSTQLRQINITSSDDGLYGLQQERSKLLYYRSQTEMYPYFLTCLDYTIDADGLSVQVMPGSSCVCVVALYDNDGKMLTVQSVNVAETGEASLSFSRESQASTLALFQLGTADKTPLAAAEKQILGT